MPEAGAHVEEHFETLAAQTYAAQFGMWVFLATEVVFFGALFALYAAYRASFPAAFAEGTRHTALALGTVNTFILLSASLLVAMAVGMIRREQSQRAALLLVGAAALGVVFVALKALEYRSHFQHGLLPGYYFHSTELAGRGLGAFFTLYYLMTGLHLLHVAIGVVILAGLAVLSWQARFSSVYHTPVELGGMYWHFVDIVWLFLWPLFYLTH